MSLVNKGGKCCFADFLRFPLQRVPLATLDLEYAAQQGGRPWLLHWENRVDVTVSHKL